MRTRLRRVRVGACVTALAALAAAFGSVRSSSPPSSTAQAGYSYLLWARESTARIWVLDAQGGMVREHVLPWTARTSPGEVWYPRELMMGPDGTRRLLWTEPSQGRSVAWILDESFGKVGERTFQASNPAANWYTTNLEKDADGTGRLLWFNGFVGSAVLWGLDANEAKVSTRIFAPAADPGAWVPIDYSRAPDGSGRLVWTYVWNGTGPWGGKSAVWFLDANDQKLGSQVLLYEPDWFLRTYHFGNDGRLRFLLGNDIEGKGKVCTALADTTTVPTAEGWGVGKCRTFGPERGWILRSYTGNVPLDLSAHQQAMIERESQRLGFPPERFISPTEISFGDFAVSTDQLLQTVHGGSGLGDVHHLNVQLWPGGRMYLYFVDQTPTFVQKVLDQCQKWAGVAGVSCLSGGGTPRLSVYRISSGNCFANRVGLSPNASIHVDGSDYCDTHEMGHALGLVHTHQREDRDGYVDIRYQNALADGWPQLVDRFRVNYPPGPYDYFSTMHYPHWAFQIAPGLSTITRLGGSINLGGSNTPTTTDVNLMRSLYPGSGIVSPASEFIAPPADDLDFYVSNVNIAGQAYTPGSMPTVNPGDAFSMTIRATNSGRPWLASDGFSMEVRRTGALDLAGGPDPSRVIVPVNYSVASHGQFTIQFGATVPATAPPSAVLLRVSLLDSSGAPLVGRSIDLYISGLPNSTGSARMVSVQPQLGVVPVGGLLPFEVKVENPTNHPEMVRVRGYIGGATVTDPQPSFQVRTIEADQTATFVYSVVAPPTPGPIKAYGQLYTLTGSAPYDGGEGPEVLVTNPPSCGGCDFTAVPCGEEGHCVNNPAVGCGLAHACGTYCEESADVQLVTTSPNPVPPNTPFTVSARVKNLSTQVNTVSVRGYTDLAGAAPADAWHHDQAMQPYETRTFHFPFMAPASGSFQSYGQVFCPGAPLPFAGNASSPASVGGGGGGTYTGITPSASIVHVGPQPATAGGTISLYARVHNHNNYTTSFYLRPYATAPEFQELPRLAVSIPPHTDLTEHFAFAVPGTPGATLDLHFQVEYTVGQALSGDSATGIPIGAPGPSPTPTPPPEEICPGPDDGDFTGCLVDGQGHQSYRTCQSCRSAHAWASSCTLKQNLNWCWKPQ